MNVELTRREILVLCSQLKPSNHPMNDYQREVKDLYIKLANRVTDNA